ncbi:type I restriction-modification system endonuclease [Paenibacillus psychroresistens]|uniref:Type I restriction-modification system endonuclease n=2 Tax=Paenibacillus psychroresistens TaxID=1778678 RepID=A0A6B8RU62_9BACL|nr:type I restriction-modification system endonuclease [Paenibacillus psychroresistens]
MGQSNFEFLFTKWPILATIGETAEKNLHHDPNTTMIKLRLFGEKMTQFLYAFEQLAEPFNASQDNKIRYLKSQDLISREIFEILDTLRKKGNKATHDAFDSKQEAETLLSLSFQLGVWFMQTYGDWDFEPKEFTIPQETKSSEVLKAELDSLTHSYESKLSQLEAELAALSAVHTPDEVLKARRTQSRKAAASISLNEAETRKLIDDQLMKAGWIVDSVAIKYSKGSRPVKGKNMAISEWPLQKNYSADYALFVGLKFIGFIEAKRKKKDVYSDLEQAKEYGRLITPKANEELVGQWGDYSIPFVFATNGRPYIKQHEMKSGIWFQDLRKTTNLPKALQSWYSPEGLMELLVQDIDAATEHLKAENKDYLKEYLKLRDFQLEAIKRVEEAITNGQKSILIAMATGTGKTRMSIGLIYRLINSKRFKRILFLVDRKALGIQAADSFKESRLTNQQTFTNIFELQELDDKKPNPESKVHIATIQSIVARIENEDLGLTVDKYDCIVVDEAHRGYTLDRVMTDTEYEFRDQADYISKYMNALQYFDAVKIGLTATPALHTKELFGSPVFNYSYREAVIDGWLIDFEPPHQLTTKLKENGITWEKGSKIDVFNPATGEVENIDDLPDEVSIEIEQFNKLVLTENFNKTVLAEIAQYIDPTSRQKTLIFAATDDHADLIVDLLRKEYEGLLGQIDEKAIMKITGSIKEPLSTIKLFKNDRLPNIAVTVDLLTTGIDVPEICNLVFLRRVKSRILYEQMVGRATRLCPEVGKTHFNIFDAVGMFEALEPITNMKPVVVNPKISFEELVSGLNQFEDEQKQKEIIDMIIAKLQRKKQRLDEKGKENFSSLTGDQSVEEYLNWMKNAAPGEVNQSLQQNKHLVAFLDENKYRGNVQFISTHEDEFLRHERGYGSGKKPGDFLDEFGKFIDDNMNLIPALILVCTSPKDMTRADYKELRTIFDLHQFSEKYLQTAWKETTKKDITASIIGFIRQRVLGDALLSHEERVKSAMGKVYEMENWSPVQRNWLGRIELQLIAERVLDPNAQRAFDIEPFRSDINGSKGLDKIFKGMLQPILDNINESLYERKNA